MAESVEERIQAACAKVDQRPVSKSIKENYACIVALEKYFFREMFTMEDRLSKTIAQLNKNTQALKTAENERDQYKAKLEECEKELLSIKGTDEQPGQITEVKQIVEAQQRTMEGIEARERAKHVIITGVKEAIGDDATKKDEKEVEDILIATRSPGVVPAKIIRLGKPRQPTAAVPNPSPRPILVKTNTASDAKCVVDGAKNLKNAGEKYKRVFVKKDQHPLVRKEWNRLREVLKREREAPINVGHEIKIDYKKKEIRRDDDLLIDSFQLPFPNRGPVQD